MCDCPDGENELRPGSMSSTDPTRKCPRQGHREILTGADHAVSPPDLIGLQQCPDRKKGGQSDVRQRTKYPLQGLAVYGTVVCRLLGAPVQQLGVVIAPAVTPL